MSKSTGLTPDLPLLLAGDIGGTKTHLALWRSTSHGLERLRHAQFPSQQFPSLQAVIALFLQGESVQAAAFGIAGPVLEQTVQTTNLPWRLAASDLSSQLGGAPVRLINDLEATALGALTLPASSLRIVQQGIERKGPIAVIAAGTGLGQAYLAWDGQHHWPAATEGGHVDFSPSTPQEQRLLSWAEAQWGHVSWERFVSGPGLATLFAFLRDEQGRPVAPGVVEHLRTGSDPGAVIGEAAVAGTCETCREAALWLLRLYAAQAGNLALTVMALGGVLLGGGVIVRLLPLLDDLEFARQFANKGRYQSLLGQVPIAVILQPETALLGAAAQAQKLAEASCVA